MDFVQSLLLQKAAAAWVEADVEGEVGPTPTPAGGNRDDGTESWEEDAALGFKREEEQEQERRRLEEQAAAALQRESEAMLQRSRAWTGSEGGREMAAKRGGLPMATVGRPEVRSTCICVSMPALSQLLSLSAFPQLDPPCHALTAAATHIAFTRHLPPSLCLVSPHSLDVPSPRLTPRRGAHYASDARCGAGGAGPLRRCHCVRRDWLRKDHSG